MNVIIADDDPTMLILLKAVVEQGGHTVVASLPLALTPWDLMDDEPGDDGVLFARFQHHSSPLTPVNDVA